MNLLFEKTPTELHKSMLRTLDYEDWTSQALTGNFSIFNRLSDFQPVILQEKIYYFFIKAIDNGHVKIFDKLIELDLDKVQLLIASYKFSAFRRAVLNGNLEILEKIFELCLKPVQKMIKANHFESIRTVSANGNLEVLNKLIEKIDESTLIKITKPTISGSTSTPILRAFSNAAENGHLQIMEKLIELAPEQISNMIEDCDFNEILKIAKNRANEVLIKLINFSKYNTLNVLNKNMYEVLCMASENGNIDVFNTLLGIIDQFQIQNLINSYDYFILRKTALYGHIEVFNIFISKVEAATVQDLIQNFEFQMFHDAALCGHLAILNSLITLLDENKIQAMLESKNFKVIRNAALKGNFEMLNSLIKILDINKIQTILEHQDFEVFNKTALNGHLEVFNKCLEILGENKTQKMLESREFTVFRNTALSGHLQVFNKILEILDKNKIQQMLESKEFEIFRNCAIHGNLEFFNKITNILNKNKVQQMLKNCDFAVFRYATQAGNFEIFNKLIIKLDQNQIQQMLKLNTYEIFYNAALNSYHEILDKIIEIAGDELQAMLESNNFEVFLNLVKQNNLLVFNKLIAKLDKNKKQKMIESENFAALHNTVLYGRLEIFDKLLELAPDKVKKKIEFCLDELLDKVMESGCPHILKRLIYLNPNKAKEIIEHANRSKFYAAIRSDNFQIIYIVMLYPKVFAFAEYHSNDYSYCYDIIVYYFIELRLRDLKKEKAKLYEHNPSALFDITDTEEATTYFYIIRNIIRRNDETLLDDLRLLLDIPAVKNLAHQAITPDQPNELILLALTIGNRGAARILLSIPAVNEIASANNYYSNEQRGLFDLRMIARDNESSMRPLTKAENSRLQAVIKLYNPLIENEGIANIISSLRNALEKRYMENPAQISIIRKEEASSLITWVSNFSFTNKATQSHAPKTKDTNKTSRPLRRWFKNPILINNINNQGSQTQSLKKEDSYILKLPMTWDEFQKLNLNNDEREEALVAYFQNNDHTAWRCISDSNPWINPNAIFVKLNNDDTTKRSNFDDFLLEICVFYLAAIDNNVSPVDGHTIETRFTHFVYELAMIGRAHNWDNSREVTRPDGKKFCEEYDDLKADNPSCLQGFKRRLFKSVPGYPLLQILTFDDIEQMLCKYMREHFKSKITPENRKSLYHEWQKVIQGEAIYENSPLKKLDASPAEQEAILNLFNKHPNYGRDFKEDPGFEIHVKKRLKFTPHLSTHAEIFGGVVDLNSLLDISQNPIADESVLASSCTGDHTTVLGANSSSGLLSSASFAGGLLFPNNQKEIRLEIKTNLV